MSVSHPVARTAFYCCVLRADDAASPRPVCGDALAARNVARHRLIDDLVRRRLAEDPATRIILLGAGVDTRAFRMSGGRWWEIDDPALLAFKEERLPVDTAPNPLVRVPVSFQSDSLAEHLAPLGGDERALVIVEGVTMYLADESLVELARAVRSALPRATLICDLMTPRFTRTFSRGLRRDLERLGAGYGAGASTRGGSWSGPAMASVSATPSSAAPGRPARSASRACCSTRPAGAAGRLCRLGVRAVDGTGTRDLARLSGGPRPMEARL